MVPCEAADQSGHARGRMLTRRHPGADAGRTPLVSLPREALQAVLEGLPDATVGASRDGRIVFVNALAEELFGYRREELVGRPIECLWAERVRERYRRNLELYFELEHPLRFSAR